MDYLNWKKYLSQSHCNKHSYEKIVPYHSPIEHTNFSLVNGCFIFWAPNKWICGESFWFKIFYNKRFKLDTDFRDKVAMRPFKENVFFLLNYLKVAPILFSIVWTSYNRCHVVLSQWAHVSFVNVALVK